jgi:hypothetical protein
LFDIRIGDDAIWRRLAPRTEDAIRSGDIRKQNSWYSTRGDFIYFYVCWILGILINTYTSDISLAHSKLIIVYLDHQILFVISAVVHIVTSVDIRSFFFRCFCHLENRISTSPLIYIYIYIYASIVFSHSTQIPF